MKKARETLNVEKARDVLKNKKFSKSFVPGTRVTLKAGRQKEHVIKEVSDGRMYVKLEGLDGIFLRNHIQSYTNRLV